MIWANEVQFMSTIVTFFHPGLRLQKATATNGFYDQHSWRCFWGTQPRNLLNMKSYPFILKGSSAQRSNSTTEHDFRTAKRSYTCCCSSFTPLLSWFAWDPLLSGEHRSSLYCSCNRNHLTALSSCSTHQEEQTSSNPQLFFSQNRK